MSSTASLTELIRTLNGAGVRLSVQADRLRADAPTGALTPELRAELRARKAELLELLRNGAEGSEPAPTPVADAIPALLSHAQERVWLVQALDPEATAYNLVPIVRLEGPLDVERLRRALAAVVERHAPLRTRVVSTDGRAEQRIGPVPDALLRIEDLSHLPENEQAEAAADVVRREQARPFDLEAETPFRPVLIRKEYERHDLVTAFHHIAVDGTSLLIFYRDLLDEYAGRRPANLPIDYADYARWERERWQGERRDAELRFWTQALGDAPPVLELPVDRPRPPVQTFTGAIAQRVLDGPATAGLAELARSEGASLFMALLAAFAGALHWTSGQRDLVVGTPVDGRTRPEFRDLMGMFINQLPLRVRVPRGSSFRSLLRSARNTAREAFAHQELPFSLLVEALSPPRDRSRTPIFQATINMLPPLRGAASLEVDGVVFSAPDERELRAIFDGQAKFDLTLYGREQEDRIPLSLVYNRDLFSEERMEALLGLVERLLVEGARDPDRPVDALLALPPQPSPWPRDEPDQAGSTVIDRFLAIAAERADAPALVDEDGITSWVRLRQEVERIARLVGSATEREPRGPVGIFVEHRSPAAGAILGALRAGCPYVPLDPAFPEARLRFMAEDAGTEVILTDPALIERATSVFGDRVRIIALTEIPSAETPLPPPPSPEEPAYLLYTSGSTGTPKAVVQTHRNLIRQADRYGRVLALGPADRVTLTASISFDASLMDLFGGLLQRATVVFVDLRKLDLGALPDVLHTLRSTTLHTTPTVFRALARATAGVRFPGIRTVVLGGESVSSFEVAYFDESFPPNSRLLNLYGASEHSFSLACSIDRDTHRRTTEIPIGWPVGDVEPLLLDEDGIPDPVRGELALRSDASAQGYWNRPELTARAFTPDAERPGTTLYRTGDMVRRRADGAYLFLHRTDQQLKIRGHRLEPREVESVLAAHTSVMEVAVHGPTAPDGDPVLTACVVLRSDNRREDLLPELQAWCRAQLPAFAVPSGWVIVDALPRTPSGKVDRRHLPRDSRDSDRTGVAPRSEEEAILRGIWAEILARREDEVGVTDDFFGLGGHSLSATQVVARIRDIFEVELPLRRFFDHPTIAETAQWMRSSDVARASFPPIARRPVEPESPLLLSFSQERMWFMQRLSPESTAYHMGGAALLDGVLDLERLRVAVECVVRRQESLRTRIPTERGKPFQAIDPDANHEFRVADLTSAPEEERLERARDLAVEALNRPYDLAAGPLFRVLVVRLGDERHLIAIGIHHIISDLWSIGILGREIAAAYDQPTTEAEFALSATYGDYATWQRSWLAEGPLETQLRYWMERLRGMPTLELPTDHPRPRFYRFEGGILRAELPSRLRERIHRLSAAARATPFMALMAALDALLYAHSRQTDLAVGVPIANRTQTATEGMIGAFVNTLVHRNDLSGNPTFRELLARVRTTALEAYAHQDVPFELLVKELDPPRDTSRSPLFQVLFNVGNIRVDSAELPGITRSLVPLDRGGAQFDLTLNVAEDAIALGYNSTLYTRETAERLLGHYLEILERAVGDPEIRLAELAAVSTADEARLLGTWNRTERPCPRETNVPELLVASAERTPHQLAIESPSGSYTYAELLEAAQRITAALVEMGVRPGDRVGILLERSREMLAALVGILGAGAAYVPVDPAYPAARVVYMLENAEAAALVTHRGLERRYDLDVPTLDLDRDALPPPVSFQATHPEQAAYVIYTSGSTGKPKGVEVPHGAMVNFLFAMAAEPGLGADDVVLAVTTISFDIAVLELYLPLTVGARIVMVAEKETTDGRRLAQRLEDARVTVLQATPSTFKLLLAAGWTGNRDLRVLCGGEPLPRRLADELLERTAEVWNVYGPTETTVWSTLQRIRRDEPILIGRPIANTSAYVLDETQRLVPIGTPGELYIGGAGVATGYRNRPDLTAERFIQSPFRSGERLYRTGDQVRFRADGRLEHLGRLDHQVKVRGFRIELGEVEAILRAHAAVRDAVVIARDDRLVAYLVFVDAPPATAELRRWMAEGLPAYMMPSVFVPLEELPLTPNGKVDRMLLPDATDVAHEMTGTTPPEHPNEVLIAEVWSELLELDQVSVEDNFFELGGHSLLAMEVVALLEERTGGYRLDPRALFFQSLGELAKSLPSTEATPV